MGTGWNRPGVDIGKDPATRASEPPVPEKAQMSATVAARMFAGELLRAINAVFRYIEPASANGMEGAPCPRKC